MEKEARVARSNATWQRPALSTDWHLDAKCKDMDSWLFNADRFRRGTSELEMRVAAGKLCAGCPVMKQCALDALQPLAVSTIRAGVPIPPTPSPKGRKNLERTLWSIARGSGQV